MDPFITDLGDVEAIDNNTNKKIHLPRYGVWKYDAGKGKPQVVETGDDLEALKKKYGVKTVVKPRESTPNKAQRLAQLCESPMNGLMVLRKTIKVFSDRMLSDDEYEIEPGRVVNMSGRFPDMDVAQLLIKLGADAHVWYTKLSALERAI